MTNGRGRSPASPALCSRLWAPLEEETKRKGSSKAVPALSATLEMQSVYMGSIFNSSLSKVKVKVT